MYSNTNTASTMPVNYVMIESPYPIETNSASQYQKLKFGIFENVILYIGLMLIFNEIFKYIFSRRGIKKHIITQQKIPPLNKINKMPDEQAASIVGNFKKYIHWGHSIGVDDVSQYSNTNTKDFIKYLNSINEVRNPKKYLEKIHEWMKKQPTLPTNPTFSDGSTSEEHFINSLSPVNRHLADFNPDNFNKMHEEILVIFTVYDIKKGEYYTIGDYLVLITDIKENPYWDSTAKKIFNIIVYNRIDAIGFSHNPKRIFNKNSFVCVDNVNGSNTIKLCYEGTHYQRTSTKYCVGSVKELDLNYIKSNEDKYDWNHTMTSRLTYTSSKRPLLDVTAKKMDNKTLENLFNCYILSNLYPTNEETIKKCEIGKYLDDQLVKGDPTNLKIQSDFVDTFDFLFPD